MRYTVSLVVHAPVKIAGFLPSLLPLIEDCFRLVIRVRTSFSVMLDILCARLWHMNTQSCDTYMYEAFLLSGRKYSIAFSC